MGSLEALYQQVILDHAREKHGHGLRAEPSAEGSVAEGSVAEGSEAEGQSSALRTAESRQYNPLCGDEVTVRLLVGEADTEPVVVDLSWAGEGCSISQAATSVLYDLVIGRPVAETRVVVEGYRQMLRSRGEGEPDEELLADAVAFAGVGRHANRVKCAMLGWTAFEDALLRTGVVAQASKD